MKTWDNQLFRLRRVHRAGRTARGRGWCYRRSRAGACSNISLNGTNALYLNPAQQGWRHVPGTRASTRAAAGSTSARRRRLTPHPDLWLGDWTGEIVGEGRARLTERARPDDGAAPGARVRACRGLGGADGRAAR
jgi:hypothetical protein